MWQPLRVCGPSLFAWQDTMCWVTQVANAESWPQFQCTDTRPGHNHCTFWSSRLWNTCIHYLTSLVASSCSISIFLSLNMCFSLTQTQAHTQTNRKQRCVFVYEFVYLSKCSLLDLTISCLWLGMMRILSHSFRWFLWWALGSALWALQLCLCDQLSDMQVSPWAVYKSIMSSILQMFIPIHIRLCEHII